MERKFHALHIMSNVHRAVVVMRSKSRLKVETDEEKKARFSEECSWYEIILCSVLLSSGICNWWHLCIISPFDP